jgi:glutamine amidotransferase
MARLFGLIGNRADIGGRILAFESEVLRVRGDVTAAPRKASLGWGVGFYQGGEVLMRRRPLDERTELEAAQLAGDVRTDVLIGHVRNATVGSLRTENTHPFRYRQWLFAQTGTIDGYDGVRERLIATIPEFLRSGIRGETDSEVLFHVFLSFLHDAGLLNDPLVDAKPAREALRSCLAVVDGMCAEVGSKPAELNLLVTNGEYVLALHRNHTMSYRVFRGRDDAEAIIGEDAQLRRKTPELAQMHFTLIASDFDQPAPARWKAVSGPSIVTLTRADDPKVEAL